MKKLAWVWLKDLTFSRYLKQHRVGSSLQYHVDANLESTVQVSWDPLFFTSKPPLDGSYLPSMNHTEATVCVLPMEA